MKPGGICNYSGKRAYGSHEEAARKGCFFFPKILVRRFGAYRCEQCKYWHATSLKK